MDQLSLEHQDRALMGFLTLDPATCGSHQPHVLYGRLPAELTVDMTALSPALTRLMELNLRFIMALAACQDFFLPIFAVLQDCAQKIKHSLRPRTNQDSLLWRQDLMEFLAWDSLDWLSLMFCLLLTQWSTRVK